MSGEEETPSASQVAGLDVLASLQEVLDNRTSLMNKVHKEDNTGKKIDNIADIVNLVFSISERIYKENQERHREVTDKLEKNKELFTVKFEAVAERLDTVETVLNSTAKHADVDALRKEMREGFSSARKEMQTNMKEIQKQLMVLSRQS